MSAVNLVTVFAENKPGQMARLTGALAGAAVNIRWVTIATTEGFGVFKFLVDRTETAGQCLRQIGCVVSLIEVLALEVEDRPGGLQRVADCLAGEGINVENASGFVANNRAVLLIEIHDPAQARAALARHGFRLLDREEILSL